MKTKSKPIVSNFSKNAKNTGNTKNTNAKAILSTIGKKITFPDATEFPVHSIFDVGENYTQVCYFNDNLPQILWVPNHFITND